MFFHRVKVAKRPAHGKNTRKLLNLTAVFNLNIHSYIILLSFALRTFCATESTKELGTREKSLQAPFARAAKGEPSVGHLLATPDFRLFSGCCGTHCVRQFWKNIIAALRLNGPHTMAWKQSALRWIFQRCRFAFSDGLPFGADISASVISKKNRHR